MRALPSPRRTVGGGSGSALQQARLVSPASRRGASTSTRVEVGSIVIANEAFSKSSSHFVWNVDRGSYRNRLTISGNYAADFRVALSRMSTRSPNTRDARLSVASVTPVSLGSSMRLMTVRLVRISFASRLCETLLRFIAWRSCSASVFLMARSSVSSRMFISSRKELRLEPMCFLLIVPPPL